MRQNATLDTYIIIRDTGRMRDIKKKIKKKQKKQVHNTTATVLIFIGKILFVLIC